MIKVIAIQEMIQSDKQFFNINRIYAQAKE